MQVLPPRSGVPVGLRWRAQVCNYPLPGDWLQFYEDDLLSVIISLLELWPFAPILLFPLKALVFRSKQDGRMFASSLYHE